MTSNFTFRIGETPDGQPVRMDLGTLIDTKLLGIANSGGGKSYLLRVIIERTAKKVQWIIIDPEGDYNTLRSKFDFLLVGAEGELPVDARSAGLLARKIMETRLSVIVDLYGLMDTRAEWAGNFLKSLMNLPKTLHTPVIVAVDEAHKFAPNVIPADLDKEARQALQFARRMVCNLTDSGRKQSRGAAILSQRISKLASDARGDLNNNLIGRMAQDLDRERAADILGLSKRDSLQLRSLSPGTFFAFGPAFLMDGIFQVKIDACETYHPKPGEHRLVDVPPASQSLKRIVEQMADLPQQAQREADELTTLRQRNAELERQLRAKPAQLNLPTPESVIREIKIPVFKDGEVTRLEATITGLSQVGTQLETFSAQLQTSIKEVSVALQAAAAAQQAPVPSSHRLPTPPLAPRQAPIPATAQKALTTQADTTVENISGPEQSILDAIAWFEGLGIQDPQQSAVAFLAGYSSKSKAYSNPRGRLKTKALVEYLADDRIGLIPGGRAVAHAPEMPLTREELQQRVLSILGGPEQRILKPLLAAYPESISKVDLASLAGYPVNNKAFTNPLGRLRSLGIIEYLTDDRQSGVQRSRVRALPVLFLE